MTFPYLPYFLEWFLIPNTPIRMELRSTGYGGASSVVLSKMERRSLHRIHMSSGETDMSPFMRPVDLQKRKEKPREKIRRKKKRRILCGVVGTPHTLMFSFVKFARNTGIFGGMGKNKNFNVVIPRIVRWVQHTATFHSSTLPETWSLSR